MKAHSSKKKSCVWIFTGAVFVMAPHTHRVDGGRHCGVSLWYNTILPWKGWDSWHVHHYEWSMTELCALRQAKQEQYIPYDFTDPVVERQCMCADREQVSGCPVKAGVRDRQERWQSQGHFEIMDMSTILTVVMVLWNLETSKHTMLYILNMYGLLYNNYTSKTV